MAKTTSARIETLEKEIEQKENLKRQLRQKLKEEQRKARTRRLCTRMGLLENLLPGTIPLSEEQFQTFLKKTVANDHGRRELAKLTARGDTSAPPAEKEHADTAKAPASPATAPQGNATPAPAKPATAQQAVPAPPGRDGGERKEG